MEKGKALDTKFEQIDALDAKIRSLKMQLAIKKTEVNKALNEGNEELAQELTNQIEMKKKQIEDYMAIIKTLNGEIRNNWRQPEKIQVEEEKTKDEMPEKKEIKWYNFIQRFKRWIENRGQEALPEGEEEIPVNNFKESVKVAGNSEGQAPLRPPLEDDLKRTTFRPANEGDLNGKTLKPQLKGDLIETTLRPPLEDDLKRTTFRPANEGNLNGKTLKPQLKGDLIETTLRPANEDDLKEDDLKGGEENEL